MTMSFPLEGSTLSIISAYAPTLAQSDEIKDNFYGALGDAIDEVPASHKLLVLGDFNARVGTDHTSWENTNIPSLYKVKNSYAAVNLLLK